MFNVTHNLRYILTLFFGLLIIVVVGLSYFVGEKKAQGYYSKPLSESRFEEFIKNNLTCKE